jgi:hypothetical protein
MKKPKHVVRFVQWRILPEIRCTCVCLSIHYDEMSHPNEIRICSFPCRVRMIPTYIILPTRTLKIHTVGFKQFLTCFDARYIILRGVMLEHWRTAKASQSLYKFYRTKWLSMLSEIFLSCSCSCRKIFCLFGSSRLVVFHTVCLWIQHILFYKLVH